MKRILSFTKYLTPNTFLKKARLSRKLYYYTIIGILLLVGGINFVLQLINPSGAQAAWYNEDWAYRKAINITAHTTSEKNVYININGSTSTQVDVGTYTGDGNSTKNITTVSFQPQFVFVKGNNSQLGAWTTDTMGSNNSKALTGNTAAGSGYITSLNADGFTVGNSVSGADLNVLNDTYYYIAISDTNGTNFKTFSYTGTGSAHDETVCGFTPNLVIIGGNQAAASVFRSSHTSTDSSLFNGGNSATRITNYVTNGFSVGTSSTVNSASGSYWGICAKEATDFMKTKKYTGNSVDSTNITGIGFQPDFTLTKRLDTSALAGIRFAGHVGDDSLTATGGNSTDRIQSFVSDGFQVGLNDCCNTDTFEYNSFSFKESAGGSGPAIDSSDTTKFQADCGDIRFTDSQGNVLPYYIVSGCGTSSTTVHVFMEDFPSGAQTIYMYYGNAHATNGFSSSDFSTQASNYTIGSISTEEVGPLPIAHWKFDDKSGTVAKDSSGNRSGTLSGATLPAWKTDQCLSDGCLYFNGITSNVAVSQTVPNVKSIAFWVNPGASNSGELMALNSTVHIRATSGTITAPGINSPTIYVNGVANGTISANTWNYITVTNSSAISASAITLGKGPLGVLLGFMDEVKYYPSTLTTAQIKANYIARGSGQGSGGVLGARDYSFLSKGLVGYWKMDETTANTCTGGANDNCDSSGNGFDGAWSGNATASMSAKFGAGTTFDGTGDYITVSRNSTIEPTSAMSFGAWFKSSIGSNFGRIISHGNSISGYELILYPTANGGLVECNIGVSGVENDSVSNNNMKDGNWHHVFCTFDGAQVKLYIDGILQSDIASYTGTVSADSGNPLRIGASGPAASDEYNGVIDEARIYNRAFSSKEAEQLYNFAPGPIGYWDFEESQGSVIDKSGNNNSGTWSGAGTTRYVAGKYGKAANFNGVDDKIDVGAFSSLGNPGFITMMGWIYVQNSGAADMYMFHQNSKFEARVRNASDVMCGIRAGGTFLAALFDTNIPFYNSWHHLACVYDGQNIIVYIDGIRRDSTVKEGELNNGSQNLNLGATDAGGGPVLGKMDELKIYNYARTNKQIIEDMNANHPLGGSPVGSMIGHWKFDSGSGNVASNSGSLGGVAHGAMYNFSSPPSQISGWSNDGKVKKALNFDGSDDIVEAGSDSSVDNLSSLTASAWINPRSTGEGSAGRIIEKANTTTPTSGWTFYLNSSNQLQFTVDHTTDLNVVSTTTVPLSSWSHVAVTWDGSTTATNVHIYINGKEVSYTTQTNGSGARVTDASEILRIGNDRLRATTFDGWIDEVKLYNSVLTKAEVQIDMNQGSSLTFGVLGTDVDGKTASNSASRMYCPPGDTTADCAPVGEWRFEERRGSIATDTSTNSNDATLINAPQYVSGKVGAALNFVSSSSQSVDVTNTISGIKTLSYWVKPTSTTTSMVALSASAYVTASSGTISATGFTGPTIYVNGQVSSTLSANVWQLVTVTTGTGISGSAIKFGLANGTYFNGQLDGVRVYTYALSPSQVAWEYNRGKPVSYWKVDECSGTTLKNTSGNGLNQTITIGGGGTANVGTCTTSSTAWGGSSGAGKFNYAITFDGTDDYASTSASTVTHQSQTTTNTLSWGGWFNPASSIASKTLIEKNREFRLTTDGSGIPNCSIWNAGGWVTSASAVSALSLSSWSHVLCVYDGVNLRVYVNGISRGTASQTGAVTSLNYTVLSTGRDFAGTSYYQGQIDDIQIFNYNLTAAQVRTLYNQSSAVRFGPPTGTP